MPAKSWEPIPIHYPSYRQASVIGQVTAEACNRGATITADVERLGVMRSFVRSHLGPLPVPGFDSRVQGAMDRLGRRAEFHADLKFGYSVGPSNPS